MRLCGMYLPAPHEAGLAVDSKSFWHFCTVSVWTARWADGTMFHAGLFTPCGYMVVGAASRCPLSSLHKVYQYVRQWGYRPSGSSYGPLHLLEQCRCLSCGAAEWSCDCQSSGWSDKDKWDACNILCRIGRDFSGIVSEEPSEEPSG